MFHLGVWGYGHVHDEPSSVASWAVTTTSAPSAGPMATKPNPRDSRVWGSYMTLFLHCQTLRRGSRPIVRSFPSAVLLLLNWVNTNSHSPNPVYSFRNSCCCGPPFLLGNRGAMLASIERICQPATSGILVALQYPLPELHMGQRLKETAAPECACWGRRRGSWR